MNVRVKHAVNKTNSDPVQTSELLIAFCNSFTGALLSAFPEGFKRSELMQIKDERHHNTFQRSLIRVSLSQKRPTTCQTLTSSITLFKAIPLNADSQT